jgi:hypothetical protein
LNKITFVKDIDQREDVLRMVMSGDMPQQISASQRMTEHDGSKYQRPGTTPAAIRSD